MKILFLSHAFYPAIGGIESISEMLVDQFVSQGHDVQLLTWSTSSEEEIFSYKIVRFPSISDIIKGIKWADLIFENNPCTRMSWPNIIFKKPIITGIQTWIAKSDGHISFTQHLKKQWLKGSTKLIACSKAVQQSLPSSSIVIGNPYNEQVFKLKPEIERSYDFVFLGRLVSDKGAELAIDAFYELVQEIKYSRLTIIGDGPERATLELKVREYGISDQVVFAGPLRGEKIVDLLNAHKYLLVPSLWREPFGIVALEGIACGCIPIVADGGGLPDAVGNAGLVFSRGSRESLLKQMKELVLDKSIHEKLSAESFSHLKSHSSKYVASQYLSVFKQVLKS